LGSDRPPLRREGLAVALEGPVAVQVLFVRLGRLGWLVKHAERMDPIGVALEHPGHEVRVRTPRRLAEADSHLADGPLGQPVAASDVAIREPPQRDLALDGSNRRVCGEVGWARQAKPQPRG